MRGWIAVAMLACAGPKVDGPNASDAATDEESDTDSDTDADTDADGDVDTAVDTGVAGCPAPWTLPTGDLADCTVQVGLDDEDDGTVEQGRAERYDGLGRLVHVYHDQPGGSAVDSHTEYVWDASGYLTEVRADYDADGTVDTVTTHTRDAAGFLVETVYAGEGAGRETFTNGPCGAITADYDADGDGAIDVRTTTVYSLALVSRSYDDAADGTVDRGDTTSHDPVLGRPVRYESESDASHAGPEYVTDYTYDAEGRFDVISHEYAPGAFSRDIWTYGADGRWSDILHQSAAWPPLRETATWNCP